MHRLLVLLGTFQLVGGLPVLAHDLWLEPSSFTPDPQERVAIELLIGHGEEIEILGRTDDRIERFEAMAVRSERADPVPVPGADGARPAGVVSSVTEPMAVVYVSTESFSKLSPDAFDAYLEEEGLNGVLELRERNGRDRDPGLERFSRSLKTLVNPGGGTPVDRTTGIPLELRIVETEAEDDGYGIELVLTFRNEPLAGALVDAEPLGSSPAGDGPRKGRTGDDGAVPFRLSPGEWRLSTVHMVPSSASDADWRSYWATLTFSLPPLSGSND